MTALGLEPRRALLRAAADPDGMLPAGVNRRTALVLADAGYIERWPVLPGDVRTIREYVWPQDVYVTPEGRAEAERLGALPAVGRVVVIPCGSAKLRGFRSFPAGELYIGGYHRACRAAADRLVARDGGRALILSAKYGLVSPMRALWTYEMRLGHPDSVKPERLHRQARAMGLTDAHATVLAGREYTALAREVWPDAVTPLAGVGGMGLQKRFLGQLAA